LVDDRDPRAAARRSRDFWNTRAQRSGGDPVRAAGLDDPVANACIEAVQRRIVTRALAFLARRRDLPGAALLDLGCGSGRWIQTVRRAGWRYIGMDAAGDMLALARAGDPGAPLVAADGAWLPFAGASFAAVCSIAAVHHNPYEVQDRMLAEMVRVLDHDGALFLFEGVGRRGAGGSFYWPRPLDDWMEALRRLGLSCVWHRGARYLILASAMERISKRGRQQSGDSSQEALARRWRRGLSRVDVWLDPYLMSVLPSRCLNRVAMIFGRSRRKT
jgi:SAM-dependent methyltransferase